MNPLDEIRQAMNRRAFLGTAAGGLGAMALGSLLGTNRLLGQEPAIGGAQVHPTATAKRVVSIAASRWPGFGSGMNSWKLASPVKLMWKRRSHHIIMSGFF